MRPVPCLVIAMVRTNLPPSSSLLSSLELSNTKSISLKYEPASEPLHISVKWLFTPTSAAFSSSSHKACTEELQGYLAHKQTPTPLRRTRFVLVRTNRFPSTFLGLSHRCIVHFVKILITSFFLINVELFRYSLNMISLLIFVCDLSDY